MLAALVGEDVDGGVDGAGLRVFGDGEDCAGGVVADGVVEGGQWGRNESRCGSFVVAGDVERGDGYVAGAGERGAPSSASSRTRRSAGQKSSRRRKTPQMMCQRL
jgi:hypothetical protein